MRVIFVLAAFIVMNTAHARVYRVAPSSICADEQTSSVTKKLFCENSDLFSEEAFCTEINCLLASHISHCRRSLENIVRELSIDLTQESDHYRELERNYLQFCRDER